MWLVFGFSYRLVRCKKSMRSNFLSKSNVHQAIWAIIVATIVGVAAFIFGRMSGPEKIVVTNPPDDPSPLIVQVAPNVDTEDANSSLRTIAAHLEAIRNIQMGKGLAEELEATRKTTSKISFNLPQVPRFRMPDNVKGYTRAGLIGFGEAACPDPEVPRESVLLIQMNIEPHVRMESLTPAVIQMDKPDASGGITHVLRQQFELNNGMNIFRLSLNLAKGEYHIEVGFYLRTDLNEEFPEFHSVRCPIIVRS